MKEKKRSKRDELILRMVTEPRWWVRAWYHFLLLFVR